MFNIHFYFLYVNKNYCKLILLYFVTATERLRLSGMPAPCVLSPDSVIDTGILSIIITMSRQSFSDHQDYTHTYSKNNITIYTTIIKLKTLHFI